MILYKKRITGLLCLAFILLSCSSVLIGQTVTGTTDNKSKVFFNVLDYGAKRDGKTKATTAVKRAIDAAAALGGGTIYFPPGVFLTGPIHFKSNITIHIDAGCVLKFSDDFDDYLPMVKSRWEGTVNMNFSPLFYAYQVENIAITGRGTIDGQGQKWWDQLNKIKAEFKQYGDSKTVTKWQKMHQELNKGIDHEDWHTRDGHFFRPPLIQPFECKNVLVSGVTLINSPFWTINPVFCKNMVIDGVTIVNPPNAPNTDGIDPSSCSQVRISNCFITVGDDCIVIKSGKDEDGRKYNVPSEDITITNCSMLAGHGGVVIGSEMSGGVKGITISNCVFNGTDRGIRIKSMRGRGAAIEDVRVDNIVMRDIKGEAFAINMFYKKTDPEPMSVRTPTFRNFHFSNITVISTRKAGAILGLPENPVENLTFNDINVIDAEEGFIMKVAKNVEFHNVSVNCSKGSPFMAEDISGIELEGVKTFKPTENVALISLKNVQDAFISNCNPLKNTSLFLQVDGASTTDILLKGNNLRKITAPVKVGKDVNKEAVIVE